MSFVSVKKLYDSITQKLEQLWMRKFRCLLFVLKQSYICYYIICIVVPLKNRLRHRCFPVNFVKFLRIPFLQNTSGRLLLIKFSSWTFSFQSSKIFNWKPRKCPSKILANKNFLQTFYNIGCSRTCLIQSCSKKYL